MNSNSPPTFDLLTLALRLGLAMLVGGAIGWNRQIHNKAAGLRTHMLVSVGSALFVLIPLQVDQAQVGDALSRAIQGVATGIGFLGAGEILQRSRQKHDKPVVTGLTSAAAIWVAAALGIAAGCGFWQLSLMGTLFVLFILAAVKRFEETVLHSSEDDS